LHSKLTIALCWTLQLQLLGCLSGVEMVLKDVGYPVKLGSGVAAAAAYLSNTTPMIESRL
jgi:alanine-glyoxylate transaminase / serine-glyoxylate transaminase / serine-pyruvate transaminase